MARRTRRTSSSHGSKSRSSLRRVSVAKDGSAAGAASDATAYDEGDDAVSFDKLPVRDLGTASESDDSHRRLFTHVYSSDSHSEASQLKASQSQQLLVRELQALLERQEAYSTWLQASLLRTQVLCEQQSSVLVELVTALHSSEPSKAVSEKRDVWLTRIELHGELGAESPPAFPVHRTSGRTRKTSLRLSNSSSRLSDSETGNPTSSSATNLTSTLSSASSDDDADETTDSSMPSARTTTQSFTTQAFTATLATIPDNDEDEDEDDGPAAKLSPRTGSLMLGAISRASPTLRQRSDSQAVPAALKKEVSVGAMPLGRVVPRMPGLGPPKAAAASNEPMLLPAPAIGSAKVPVNKDRRFDFATRGRSQSVNLSPRGSMSLSSSVRLLASNSSSQSGGNGGGNGGNGGGGASISVQDVALMSPPSPEPGGSLGSSASSRHSTTDKRRVSTTPASNDASSSKDSASQQGDDGKASSARRTSSSAAASGGSGAANAAAVLSGAHTINLSTDTVLLHETLGKGGTASVYRASASGFSFACKVYHAEELSDAERAAAERDVAMMEAMAHTNVLRTLGHKYARLGRLLLYVELAGGTLADAIKAKRDAPPSAAGGFAPVDILRAIQQVVAAIEYLHHRPQPIVHRDVKSENVFVACSAGSQLDAIGALHLKLGDFDSARYLGTERANGDRGALWRLKLRTTASKRRTVRLSMNVGTPEFMAPEMVASQKGNGSYDEKVDVWSVGMVLFELLTLDVPYRLNGLSRFELLDAVASGVRPTVDAALQKKVALRKLWKLWNKLTEFDAERRLSAAAAAKRVHKVLKSLSSLPV